MTDQRFRREYRLRSSLDFERVFARRCSAGDAVLVVYAAPADIPCDHPRLGFVVSRKVGNAVRRNRWKRLIREAFRLHRLELSPGIDLVVLPRPETTPTLAAIAQSLPSLARRAVRRLNQPPRTDRRRP